MPARRYDAPRGTSSAPRRGPHGTSGDARHGATEHPGTPGTGPRNIRGHLAQGPRNSGTPPRRLGSPAHHGGRGRSTAPRQGPAGHPGTPRHGGTSHPGTPGHGATRHPGTPGTGPRDIQVRPSTGLTKLRHADAAPRNPGAPWRTGPLHGATAGARRPSGYATAHSGALQQGPAEPRCVSAPRRPPVGRCLCRDAGLHDLSGCGEADLSFRLRVGLRRRGLADHHSGQA